MSKFKIGDIVRGTDKDGLYVFTNINMTKGIVLNVDSSNNDIKVKILRHTQGKKIGEAFWVNSKYFELVSNDKIDITRDGSEVHAVLKSGNEVIKRSFARCHPRDLFDFEAGTRLAIDRLFEKEAIRLYLKGVLPSNRNAHYGFIGESTSMKDSLGNPLFVGDEVIYFNAKKPRGVQYSIVVHSRNDNSTFIEGIKNDCRRNNATIEDYVVIKYAPYTDLQQGDEIDGVEVVIEE